MKVTHCDVMSRPWGTHVKLLLRDPRSVEVPTEQDPARFSLHSTSHSFIRTQQLGLTVELSNATCPLLSAAMKINSTILSIFNAV